jgi:bifunctional UDP-N-acetylglucosamine pyrophosphorylase/glucosamine-1-phosphate N-acetyltransferase
VWKRQAFGGMAAHHERTNGPLAIVVLAAGKGTRMKSDLHKVLHPIAGRPMLEHLLASSAELAPQRQVVVAGHGREQLEARWEPRCDRASGTAARHRPCRAAGAGALAGFRGDVLILYGDVPFVPPQPCAR